MASLLRVWALCWLGLLHVSSLGGLPEQQFFHEPLNRTERRASHDCVATIGTRLRGPVRPLVCLALV